MKKRKCKIKKNVRGGGGKEPRFGIEHPLFSLGDLHLHCSIVVFLGKHKFLFFPPGVPLLGGGGGGEYFSYDTHHTKLHICSDFHLTRCHSLNAIACHTDVQNWLKSVHGIQFYLNALYIAGIIM